MIRVFDTSVLVAAFVEGHTRHIDALARFKKACRGDSQPYMAAHSLAELFAVLTRLPVSPRISPRLARRMIRENLRGARVIALSATDYRKVIDHMADLDLSGGSIYDALIVHAARKVEADRLFTLNGRDFRRLWPDAGSRLVVL